MHRPTLIKCSPAQMLKSFPRLCVMFCSVAPVHLDFRQSGNVLKIVLFVILLAGVSSRPHVRIVKIHRIQLQPVCVQMQGWTALRWA